MEDLREVAQRRSVGLRAVDGGANEHAAGLLWSPGYAAGKLLVVELTLPGVQERLVCDQDGEIAGVVSMKQGRSIGDTGVDDVRDGGIQPESLVATKGGKTSEQAVILGALSWLGVASIAAEVEPVSVVL